jgi:hypothetical protein
MPRRPPDESAPRRNARRGRSHRWVTSASVARPGDGGAGSGVSPSRAGGSRPTSRVRDFDDSRQRVLPADSFIWSRHLTGRSRVTLGAGPGGLGAERPDRATIPDLTGRRVYAARRTPRTRGFEVEIKKRSGGPLAPFSNPGRSSVSIRSASLGAASAPPSRSSWPIRPSAIRLHGRVSEAERRGLRLRRRQRRAPVPLGARPGGRRRSLRPRPRRRRLGLRGVLGAWDLRGRSDHLNGRAVGRAWS